MLKTFCLHECLYYNIVSLVIYSSFGFVLFWGQESQSCVNCPVSVVFILLAAAVSNVGVPSPMRSGYLELKIMAESTSCLCVCALISGDNTTLTERRLMKALLAAQDGGVDRRKSMGQKSNTHFSHTQRDVWLVHYRSSVMPNRATLSRDRPILVFQGRYTDANY